MAYRIVGSHMLRHIILLFNFKFKFIIAPDIICEMDFHFSISKKLSVLQVNELLDEMKEELLFN